MPEYHKFIGTDDQLKVNFRCLASDMPETLGGLRKLLKAKKISLISGLTEDEILGLPDTLSDLVLATDWVKQGPSTYRINWISSGQK